MKFFMNHITEAMASLKMFIEYFKSSIPKIISIMAEKNNYIPLKKDIFIDNIQTDRIK